ncbi:MAG: Wzz/FepE/Etk N-terminal domain-containing protein [Desulfobacula sp.]|jgi:uncharacterized protein involved in exopolysaccharide biosynthesis|nr:Wzz/FepE/Etk N-terminal domain-containing protein [Desulfobacula sp.]
MAITTLKSTRDFARIWFFWKRPAILIFCLIVVSICSWSFTQTPIYESTAKILLLPKTNDELVVSAGMGRTQYDIQGVDQAEINTQIELIKSKEVFDKTKAFFNKTGSGAKDSFEIQGMFDRLKFTKKTNILIGSLAVEPVYDSNLILVALESPNQHQVADVLNKLVDIYIKHHKSMYSLEESEEFYDEQKQHYAKSLNNARNKLKDYHRNNNIVNMESQIQANIGLLSTFYEQLQNLEIAIAETEARISMVNAGLNVSGDQITMSKEMRSLPIIVELARGLVPLLITRTEISKTFTRESREFKQINDQIAMLRQEIKIESKNASRTDNMENQTLKTKRDVLATKIQYLKEQIKDFQQKKEALNALELDMQIAKDNYLLYGTKTEDSRLYVKRNKSNLSNVVIAESAVTPLKQKSPNNLLAFVVSIILGLFAAFILPFLLETIDHNLKTADDIENILSLPVVCTYNEL